MLFKRITNGLATVRAMGLAVMAGGMLCEPTLAAGAYVSEHASAERFALADQSATAEVLIDTDDAEVVRIAAKDFISDVERVTGKLPILKEKPQGASSSVVIIGTIGKSKLIDALIRAGKLEVKDVQGLWESFVITGIENPMPGVKQALVIAGSDRRGTAYGVYELSRRIGVSPWYWWADVTPERSKALHLSTERVRVGPPAVKYRGIFINDEMWGIRPWAEGTFAPDEGKGLGPKTYAKVFELLLRLRANYIWPAMHLNTKAFHLYEENKHVANRYAIVMGGSHTEVMNRNNMPGSEWDIEHGGPWNYFEQPKAIYEYWRRGVMKWGDYENLYTVGMRGRDDEPMKGGDTKQEQIAMMERIFKDQRQILTELVHPDLTMVPQTLVAYREVLDLYDAGMKVPEDVIITWPENNFGYIRRLPTAEEQKRSGGSGVYYHIQWINGATGAYAWLNTMPPSLIFSEMNKAWQYDCRKLWVLNVGDIKPGEIGMDFFLEMAWDPDRWTHDAIGDYLESWAARDLSAGHAAEIAGIMKEYYQLAMGRRPEHLVMYAGNQPLMSSWFSHEHYGDEAAKRLARYADIAMRAEALYAKMPETRKAAFYQLVLYPVKCASLMNHKVIHADRSSHDAKSGRSTARVHARKARAASEEIIAMTEKYNEAMPGVGDKWRYMMHWAPGPWGGQRHQYEMPPLSDFNGLGKPNLLVTAEGDDRQEGSYPASSAELPDFSVYSQEKRFIDLFNTGKGEVSWQAAPSVDWVRLDQSAGTLSTGQRLWVDIDWENAPQGDAVDAEILFTSNGGSHAVKLQAFNPAAPKRDGVEGYVESHGYVSMEAEHFTRSVERGGVQWKVVENLGRSRDSVLVHPATAPSYTTAGEIAANSPSMEYDIHFFSSGEFEMHFDCLPTQPVAPDRGVRLAISLDDGPIRIAGEGVEQKPNPWKGKGQAGWDMVINLRRTYDVLKVNEPGKHTLKVWYVDTGVIVDQIVVYTEEPKTSYFGPPESFRGNGPIEQ